MKDRYLQPVTSLLMVNQAFVKEGCILKCFLSQEAVEASGWVSCADKPQWDEGRVVFLGT